jgi:hypothetical protein
MVLNFPTLNLQVGDTYNGPNGVLYTYDGVKWVGSTNVTSTIVNGNNVIQVDQSGDLVVPNGAMIIDQDGNPIQGFQGATGPTGPRGHDGSTGVQGPIGATGVTGAQGVSVTLQGTKALIADLPLTGSAGHAWIVTESNGGDLFFWNLTDGTWDNIGKIVGPQGDPGPQGEVGASGIDGATGFTGATGLRGFQGLDGATGPQGDPGATGLTGNEGATGATGPAGTDALWNFRGAYDNVASYAIGDVATYGGETWYRIDANYGEGGDIPVEGAFWTLLSQKGADGASGSGSSGPIDRLTNSSYEFTLGVDGTVNFTPSGANGKGVLQTAADLQFIAVDKSWTFGTDGSLTAPYGKLGLATGEVFGIVADADTAATVQSNNGTYTWNFGTDGALTLPGGNSKITTTGPSGQSVDLVAGPGGWAELASSTGSNYVWVDDTAAYIGTDALNSIKMWTFAKDGNMSTPGSILPNVDNVYDLGAPTARFRHVYVGPGSITVGNSVITESTTGKLVLPGVTRATSLYADEVEDAGDQTYVFSSTPTVLVDAYEYGVRSGIETPPGTYVAAEYSVDQIDGDGYIDGITVDAGGTWTQAIATANRQNPLFAYVGSDINETFNPTNWVNVPFVVRAKANDVEYEFNSGGGGANALDELSDTDISDPTTGQALVWDGENWANQDISGSGPVDLSNYQAGSDPIRLETDQSLVMLVDGVTGIDAGGSSMRLYANNHYIVLTDEGRLDLDAGIKFSDGTTQTTAYISGTNANTGNVVFDNNQMYVGGVGFLNFDDNSQAVIGTNGSYTLKVSLNEGDKTWEFDPNGVFYMPDGGSIGFNYGYIDQDPDTDNDALRISGGNGVTIKADEDGKTWRFNNDGSITFPDDTVQTTAYTGQSGGSSTVARQDTAPSAPNGTLWFSTVEGRLYIKYNDAWVDAAPLVQPQPPTELDVNSITFADATTLTSAYTNKLVNGDKEVVLNSNGDLLSSNDIIAVPTGRFVKDCGGSGSTTSMRWTRIPVTTSTELIRAYTGTEQNPDDVERAQISVEWQDNEVTGLSIKAFDRTDGITEHQWQFKGNGGLQFPDGTNQTTAYVSGQKTFLVNSTTAGQDNVITETASVYFIIPEPGYNDTADQTIVLPTDAPPGTKITVINNYNGILNVVIDQNEGIQTVTLASYENREYVLLDEPNYGRWWWETNSYSW